MLVLDFKALVLQHPSHSSLFTQSLSSISTDLYITISLISLIHCRCSHKYDITFDRFEQPLVVAEYLDEAERVFEGVSARPSRVKELLECVCWRRGALFYMYCHTAFNDKERLIASEQQLQQFLEFALKGGVVLLIP